MVTLIYVEEKKITMLITSDGVSSFMWEWQNFSDICVHVQKDMANLKVIRVVSFPRKSQIGGLPLCSESNSIEGAIRNTS